MRKRGDKKVKLGSGTRWVPDWMYAAMCKQSNRWHETLGLLFHFCLQQKRRHSCRSLHMPFVHGCPGWTLIPIFTSHVWLSGKKKNLHSIFFSLQENNVFHSVSWEIFSLHKVFVFLAFTLAQWILIILASQECQQFSAYLFQYPLCTSLSFP